MTIRKDPVDIIGAKAVADLRAAGWIIVRDDAIRLAQIAARYEADNDNVPIAKTPMANKPIAKIGENA